MAVDAAEILTPTIVNGLPSGWSWKRLDSVCEGVFDCPHSTPLLTQDRPFIARSQDMRSGVFRTDEAGHVSEDTFRERIVRAEPKYGDLLYSREGTYFGIAAEVPGGIRVCLGQRMVLLRPNSKKVNFRFLRYWLNAPVMTSYVHGFRDGTVAERLNLPTIRALPVLLPSLTEQHAIVHILGTLDDKIELNRQMNETLEAMARAIFKSWFVDFAPVRSKAEGRDPSLPKHLADLFPTRFRDSERGEIPVGWELKAVGDLAEVVGGSTPSTMEPAYWNEGIHHWVTPKRAVHIEQQIAALEEAVTANAGLAFDLAKTLIESSCKTVLSERKFEYDGSWDLPRLLKETLGQLKLVPQGLDEEQDVSESLRKMTGGLQTAIQGVCELRNTHGFASHGREAAFQQLESVQALLVARSSDAIVNFLFRIHRNYPVGESMQPRMYDDYEEFNQYVDDLHDRVRIFNEEFEPSKVLYQMAPEPYRIYLTEFQAEQKEEEGNTSADKPPGSSG